MNTHYWIQGLSKFKDVLLTYILSIILQPHLIEKTMIDEIEAVRNELANYINHPDYNLQDIATKTIYKISGLQFYSDYKLQLSNLKNFTIKQLITFSQKIVYTGRLIFVVSGSFEKTPTINFIQKTLTDINHRINPSMGIYFHNATMSSCYDIKKRVVFIKNTQSKNATILLTFPIDIYFGDKDLDILRITTSILGSGLNSLLMKKLRLHKNMIYGLSVSTKTDFCGTLLSIKISTMHKHVKNVISMTVDILKKYSRTTITEIMLKHYKLRHILELQSVCLNTPAAVSNYYIDQFFYQLGKKHKRILTLQEKTAVINKVNVKTIRSMFKKIFDMHRMSIFYMSDKKLDSI
jgi:predicted Zn-dependent peptidase